MSERHLVQLIDNDLSLRLTKWRALWKVQMDGFVRALPGPGRLVYTWLPKKKTLPLRRRAYTTGGT